MSAVKMSRRYVVRAPESVGWRFADARANAGIARRDVISRLYMIQFLLWSDRSQNKGYKRGPVEALPIELNGQVAAMALSFSCKVMKADGCTDS